MLGTDEVLKLHTVGLIRARSVAYFCLNLNPYPMGLLINGEPYIHGIDPDLDQATSNGTNPTTDALAHQQNTDKGTTKPYFEIGLGSAYAAAGAIRRGLLFNPGGAGPYTALAWEARTEDGTATGRFVQCLNVANGNPADPSNVWTPAELSLGPVITAGSYGANPDLHTFREAIVYLLQRDGSTTPPVIGGFNPTSGVVGSTVLINGNNFGASTGTVLLGSKPCNVQGWSNFQISVRVPAGATSDKFTVTTAGGSDISRDTFTVTAATVQTVPGPVSNLRATGKPGYVLLEWDGPSDTGNSPINDYEIRYAQTGGIFSTYAHSPRTVNNFQVSGLTNGLEYQFTVAPKNAKGTGPAVGPVAATPAASGSGTTPVTYTGTYTPTASDITAKCGGAGGTGQLTTRTSTDSQAAADAAAKNDAIAGITCNVATSYNTTLDKNNSVSPGGMSFVTQTASKLELNDQVDASGPTISVTITCSGTTDYLDYFSEFGNTSARYTDLNGVAHTLTLPTANTNISY